MTDKRIIKKYPNRRLYDTEISKYITLEDVKKLVLSGVDFCVKDVKTDEDLTRNILLQIISEQEHDGDPMFSTQTLTQLIRFYGNAYQSAFFRLSAKKPGTFHQPTRAVPGKTARNCANKSAIDDNKNDGTKPGTMATGTK